MKIFVPFEIWYDNTPKNGDCTIVFVMIFKCGLKITQNLIIQDYGQLWSEIKDFWIFVPKINIRVCKAVLANFWRENSYIWNIGDTNKLISNKTFWGNFTEIFFFKNEQNEPCSPSVNPESWLINWSLDSFAIFLHLSVFQLCSLRNEP